MRKTFSLLIIILLTAVSSFCQQNLVWPKVINSSGNTIKVYEPVVEQYSNNIVKSRAAISVIPAGKTDPVFGAMWTTAFLQTDRNSRIALLDKITVDEIRFPADPDTANVAKLKALLEKEIPKLKIETSLDEIESSIEESGYKNGNTDSFSTTPPRIIYTTKPSTLVLIDGDPKFKESKEMGVEMVLNTAFTIAKSNDALYLYGNNRWYTSKTISGPWTVSQNIPKSLDKLNTAIKAAERKEQDKASRDSSAAVTPEIIVSTTPAELIQTNGDADFSPIQGTSLLYVTNTNNDLFMNINQQSYYVLISGRWYKSGNLKGDWSYIASDKLPEDFSKIPDSSAKGDVLPSVAGTPEAQDAVLDAQIPQTKKIDRKTATTKVTYDGDPRFTNIEGTNLQYAINTNSTVLLSNNTYFCVDSGVWYQSKTPTGPWAVSDTRPAEVNKIPADVPVYNVKYVYVYDVTPQYVYVGYTPGYMGSYIYGGTVIYGTGFYYNPWYGPYYYPRPVTYGFSVHYNPWTGWGVGFHYSAGWFHGGIYWGVGYHGGYWGPPMYGPPYYHRPGYPPYYRPPYYPGHGYRPPPRPTPYPTRPANGRPSTLPATRPGTGRPTTLPAIGPSTRPATGNNGTRPGTMPANQGQNNITTDRQGNIFQRNGNNTWQQRSGNHWQNVNQNRQAEINNLNRQQQYRDRGDMRTNSFNQSRPQQNHSRQQMSRPAGGGRR